MNRNSRASVNLSKFMKILMVKRLESSFYAFRLTLERFIKSYTRVIEEFRNGNVYISKKHINKVFELLEDDNQEAIERLLEEDKAERLSAKEFSPAFMRDLKSDLALLHKVQELWGRSAATQSGRLFVKFSSRN